MLTPRAVSAPPPSRNRVKGQIQKLILFKSRASTYNVNSCLKLDPRAKKVSTFICDTSLGRVYQKQHSRIARCNIEYLVCRMKWFRRLHLARGP